MTRSLLTAALLVAALGGTGCHRAPVPGGASGSKPEAARKQAEALAISAVNGAADAQAKAHPALARRAGVGGLVDRVVVIGTGAAEKITSKVGAVVPPATEPGPTPGQASPAASPPGPKDPPQPKPPLPRPGPTPVVKERVESTLAHQSEAEAEKDALGLACDVLEKRFAEFDPPLRYRPTPNEVAREYARGRTPRKLDEKEREFFASQGIKGDLVRVEFDVEVTPDQVRALRTRDRVAGTVRFLGGLAAVALAAFLFLRADEWTKGYLTRWLAAGAVLLAGGAAAALYFV